MGGDQHVRQQRAPRAGGRDRVEAPAVLARMCPAVPSSCKGAGQGARWIRVVDPSPVWHPRPSPVTARAVFASGAQAASARCPRWPRTRASFSPSGHPASGRSGRARWADGAEYQVGRGSPARTQCHLLRRHRTAYIWLLQRLFYTSITLYLSCALHPPPSPGCRSAYW